MTKKTSKRRRTTRFQKDKVYFTLTEAANYYNTDRKSIKKAIEQLLKNEPETKELISNSKGTVTKVSQKYLDKFFDWHSIHHSKNRKILRMNILDFYHWLVKHRWDKKKEKKITQSKYTIFIGTFFQLLRNKIIEENWIWTMPYKMGSLYMKRVTIENEETMPYNKKHYMETGEKIRYSNKHSFGQRFTLRFDRTFATFINKGITEFRAGGETRRKIRDTIFDRIGPYKKSFVGH